MACESILIAYFWNKSTDKITSLHEQMLKGFVFEQ